MKVNELRKPGKKEQKDRKLEKYQRAQSLTTLHVCFGP